MGIKASWEREDSPACGPLGLERGLTPPARQKASTMKSGMVSLERLGPVAGPSKQPKLHP